MCITVRCTPGAPRRRYRSSNRSSASLGASRPLSRVSPSGGETGAADGGGGVVVVGCNDVGRDDPPFGVGLVATTAALAGATSAVGVATGWVLKALSISV